MKMVKGAVGLRCGLMGLAVLWLTGAGIVLRAQVTNGSEQGQVAGGGQSFEVATIKPSSADEVARSVGWDGRRFWAHDTTISQMVQFAYNLQEKQIVNAPAWFGSATYDIEGQAESGKPLAAEFRVMMQRLLEERFGMKTHVEGRTMPAYALVVAKGGPKLEAAKDDPEMPPGVRIQKGLHQYMRVYGTHGTMAELAAELQRVEMDRPVVDKTGIAGEYNFSLTATSEKAHLPGDTPATGDDAPPLLFRAIQDQLGLKLEPVKTEVECLVVDHVDRPTVD